MVTGQGLAFGAGVAIVGFSLWCVVDALGRPGWAYRRVPMWKTPFVLGPLVGLWAYLLPALFLGLAYVIWLRPRLQEEQADPRGQRVQGRTRLALPGDRRAEFIPGLKAASDHGQTHGTVVRIAFDGQSTTVGLRSVRRCPVVAEAPLAV